MIKKNIIFIVLLLTMTMVAEPVLAQKKRTRLREVSQIERRKAEVLFTQGQKYYMLDELDKSKGLFEGALEIDPINPAAHFKLAQIHIRREEYEMALFHAQKAIEIDNSNKYYFLTLSEIYTKMNEFGQAAEVMEEMIATIEDSDGYLFELAALYLYGGELEKAIQTYTRIEDRFGISDQVTYQKQSIYLKLDELENALNEGRKLIEAYPAEPVFTLKQAEILMANGRNSEALQLLSDFDNQISGTPEINMLRGEIFMNESRHDSAFAAFEKGFNSPQISLDLKKDVLARYNLKLPNELFTKPLEKLVDLVVLHHETESDAHTIAGDFYLQSAQYEKALERYKTAVELQPGNFGIWQNILKLEMDSQHYDSVLEYSEKALEYFPNQSSIYFYNGVAYMVNERYEEAAYALEQAALIGGTNNSYLSVLYANLGNVYYELEDYEASDRSFEKSLSYNQNNLTALNNYAYYLATRKERLSQARKMITRVLKEYPDDANFLDTYAWVLYMLGDYEEARDILEKALELSNSGTILEHYGDVLFKLGEVDLAVEYWKKARGKDTTSEFLDKKIADKKLYE